ncbi:hypothetical protein QVD17_04532 [Tagetes erecta]|uniref:Uncharacterized protein n=1 Tax=Tagetes erecta TaxID=13708 RepID=A0AAD8PAT1_TARER|nr:hypothetical protein QVD17_04532 [Tagetes erecta]
MTSVDHSSDSPDNFTIHLHLKLKHENSVLGIHYPNPLKITFSYSRNVSMQAVLAEYKVHSLYQPTTLEGMDMVVFRVDLVGMFRSKKAEAKRLKVKLECVVTVNYTTSRKVLTRRAKPGLDSQILESIFE